MQRRGEGNRSVPNEGKNITVSTFEELIGNVIGSRSEVLVLFKCVITVINLKFYLHYKVRMLLDE